MLVHGLLREGVFSVLVTSNWCWLCSLYVMFMSMSISTCISTCANTYLCMYVSVPVPVPAPVCVHVGMYG